MTHSITNPDTFFGFQLGSDRHIARWERIVEYFRLLERQSGKLRVVDMGPSTEGNPFLLVIISSPQNLANLERLRQINAQIADPRGLSDAQSRRLVQQGRAVVCQSMSLHASEISGTQMAPELAYELISQTDDETLGILEHVIFLMVPCFNPDGQVMVTDWYNQYLGTEYEGSPLPWLYHTYSGHDNNRDAFMLNLVESQYMARILFQDWHPQVFQDHHEMGSYGPRCCVMPYCEPLHPHADPLIWREISWYGAHMAYKLEEAGISGVVNAAMFPAWSHLGFHWMVNYHNITGMMDESATTRLATPIYIHKSQLQGEGGSTLRALPHYRAQTNFPNPWPGGWWRLRNLIDQEKIIARSVLDLAARHRETILHNAVQKALRQTQRGLEDQPGVLAIRPDQHDQLAVVTLINKLLLQGIEITQAHRRVTIGDVTYPTGTYLIALSQPKRGLIKTLLERTRFPDDPWTRFPDGTPNRPYDTTTDTMAEFMGVQVDSVHLDPSRLASNKRAFAAVTTPEQPRGEVVGTSKHGYLLDGRLNDSFRVINRLLAAGRTVVRLDQPAEAAGRRFPAGAFVVRDGSTRELRAIARASGVSFYGLDRPMDADRPPVKPRRIGLYQRYWGGNMDEGWTRLVLEQFEFPYQSVRDDTIKQGERQKAFDVIILPDDTSAMIIGKDIESRLRGTPVPEAYRSGMGEEGMKAVKAFVEEGGTLIALNQACDFAIEHLGLCMANRLRGQSPKQFHCPGSTLRVQIDPMHPLAYGMPGQALVFFWDSPAFDFSPSHFNDRYQVVVQYPARDILQSGWLIGEEQIAEKAALVSVHYGRGRVILYGFRVQHRAQTHGTFKLLFNALY